jgi:hypothetical protein
MSKQAEMEDIYKSYEHLFREKLEEIDFMAQKMFLEMRVFHIPVTIYESYVQDKFRILAREVIGKEDGASESD